MIKDVNKVIEILDGVISIEPRRDYKPQLAIKIKQFIIEQEKEKQELATTLLELKKTYTNHLVEQDKIGNPFDKIKELKAELDKWKPKFEVGQEVWVETDINEFKQYIVRKILFDDLEGEDVQYHLCNITKNPDGTTDYDYLDDFINQSEIYATKQEAEASRGK